MSATVETLRIGELARRVGTTPRTIRYYEELGLLDPGSSGGAQPRAAGRHRLYGPADEERLREVMRLKDLLGLSLDELRTLIEAQDARALLRDEWHHGTPSSARRRAILNESIGHIDAPARPAAPAPRRARPPRVRARRAPRARAGAPA